jgi:hypothetical protein
MTDTANHDDSVLDMESINRDIADGAKAFHKLLCHATDDWNSWAIAIRGLRALRNFVFAQSHSSDIRSWAYRQAIGHLLQQRKYSIYDRIDKPTRSTCYKLMDSIEEITQWYMTLPASDQMRWKHPDAIAKHCPRHLVAGGKGSNKPPGKKKPAFSAEVERLKALLIKVIKRLAKYEPEAVELLDQVQPADEPNDEIGDL